MKTKESLRLKTSFFAVICPVLTYFGNFSDTLSGNHAERRWRVRGFVHPSQVLREQPNHRCKGSRFDPAQLRRRRRDDRKNDWLSQDLCHLRSHPPNGRVR